MGELSDKCDKCAACIEQKSGSDERHVIDRTTWVVVSFFLTFLFL